MKQARRIVLTAAGAVAAVAVVAAALVLINSDEGFIGCTVTYPFGWAAPLLAGGILGAATWVLLDQSRPRRHDDVSYDAGTCTQCGREILGQWRMCPYCGAMLEEEPRSASDESRLADS